MATRQANTSFRLWFYCTLRYAAEMNRLLEKLRKHLLKQGQDSVGANLARMQHPIYRRMARALEKSVPEGTDFG